MKFPDARKMVVRELYVPIGLRGQLNKQQINFLVKQKEKSSAGASVKAAEAYKE